MEIKMIEKNFLAYNASVRNVLSDKNYLSYLLQKFVGNFKGLNRDEIESLIGDITTNDEIYKVYGLSNEDSSYLDGVVKYDLLFTTRLPNSKDKIGMLINLELQSEGSDTDLKRMIYYCSRMLSSEWIVSFQKMNIKISSK